MSSAMQNELRLIDKVTVKGSAVPIGIFKFKFIYIIEFYTLDLDLKNL